MARKKKDDIETAPENAVTVNPLTSRDFFDKLTENTNFVIADEGSLMSNRKKVSTPLYAINCIYGGGIPLSLITRISGHPGGGKSTFSYQCMANYQQEYPDGIPVIYDMEASMDNARLQTLGVDTSKVLRLPATNLQDAFKNMFDILRKILEIQKTQPDITTFQVYDTLSTGGTEKQQKAIDEGGNAFGAGTMMEEPRIIKANLKNLFPYLEKIPMFLGLLEQVFTQPGAYVATVGASGNFAMKHDAHIHIIFGAPKDEYDRGFMIGTTSMVKLDKSKLSPKFVDIPCYIDATRGGRIDPVESFIRYISTENVGIVKAGAWYTIGDTIETLCEQYPAISEDIRPLVKSYRKNEFMDMAKADPDFVDLLQIRFIDVIDTIYPGQRLINGDYQKELMHGCKYFKKYFENTNKDTESSGA